MASLKFACVVLICLAVVGAPMAQAAITCGLVINNLISCLPYLQTGGTPAAACCGGVKTLLATANNTPDRQAVCKCLKDAATQYTYNLANAQALPGKCGVSIPYKISTSTNCATVKF